VFRMVSPLASAVIVRVLRVLAFFGRRPPRRPFAREARAFASLRFALSRAATGGSVSDRLR
jgi:hypothetical protein